MRREPISISKVSGKSCVIRHEEGDFILFCEGFAVGRDKSPRFLSTSALESGAKEVRWEFHLKLAGDNL